MKSRQIIKVFGSLVLALGLASCGLVPDEWLSILPVKVATCDQRLQADLRMVAPHWGPPRADMDVVWEVIATGCTGRYRIVEHPQVKPFTAFGHYFVYYQDKETVREKVTVQSVDWKDNVLDEVVAEADPFVIGPAQEKFMSPPSDARAESVRPREDGLGCRIEKESKMGPTQANIDFRLIIDGEHFGANFNGYAAKNGQVFSVPANEYKVYRGIGVVFGKSGHAVCQAYFVAPRCQISLVENSYDLVRKKLQPLGRVTKVVWDGQSHALRAGAESLMVDEVPTRTGKVLTTASVIGPEGDEGVCTAEYTVPHPELKVKAVRAIASSTWGTAAPKFAIDGTTQEGWVAQTKGKGWIRVDLGRSYRVSKVRLCIDQTKPGRSLHEVYVGRNEKRLRRIASFDGITAAGQWLERTMDERDIRYVEIKSLDSNSQISWREIEIFQCTTFRKCTNEDGGTVN